MSAQRTLFSTIVVASLLIPVASCNVVRTGRLYSAVDGAGPVVFSYDSRGKCWVTLPTGEQFTGEFTTVEHKSNTNIYKGGSYWQPWQPTYTANSTSGSTTYVSAVGSKGTMLECRVIDGKAGECVDSKGNRYTVHL